MEHVGNVMTTLEKIRKEQAEEKINFQPVQDMYSLLDTYLAEGIKDKDEMDQRQCLIVDWKNLI